MALGASIVVEVDRMFGLPKTWFTYLNLKPCHCGSLVHPLKQAAWLKARHLERKWKIFLRDGMASHRLSSKAQSA